MERTTMNSKNDPNTINDNDELGTLKKNYLALKRKICRTHELIRQYNDKVKECDRIKTELDSAHIEVKTLRTNYNGTLGKVIKLELQSTEYAKQITSLSSTVEVQETKIAGDQKHLHQLSYKLKEVEDKHAEEKMEWEMEKSVLKDKVKELQHELKITKKSNASGETKEKVKKINKPQGIEKGTNCRFENLISRVDVAVNTVDDNINIRADKNLMTDLSFGAKNDTTYPLFCDKCESLLFDPVQAICKTMTKSYEMIEAIPSYNSPNSKVILSNISSEKDRKDNKRFIFLNPPENESKSNNNSFELSKQSSSFLQKPHVVREEPSVNSVQQTTTETLTHYMDELRELRNQMKRLDKKIKKQSHKKKPPDYNYFQSSPYGDYFRNETLFKFNSLLNLTSQVLKKVNNINETNHRSNKIRKRKREYKACKLISKAIKRKRLQNNVSTSNDVWKVDSIVPCPRTDNTTSNDHLNRSPSLINNDQMLDNGTSDTNADKGKCRRINVIETANDNVSKSNSSNDKHCFSSTLIEETQPLCDTRSILESLNFNSSSQHKIIIITDKNTINDLDLTSSIGSILRATISTNDESNVSDIKKQISTPFTKESDNSENMIEVMSNSVDKDPIHVNTSDSTSNIAPNATIIKNRKRKLQTSEDNLNQSNLIKDLPTLEKNNRDIHNVESNGMGIIENKRDNISEKVINNESNVQIVNPDVVLKKKQRIIPEVKASSQEISILGNENLNVIPEMNDESVEVAQVNILDCRSLNEKETECIEKESNNKNVPKKRHSINKKKNPRSKCAFALNKHRIRSSSTFNNLRSRRSLIKVGNLKLFDSDEPISKKGKGIKEKKSIPNHACKKNNKTKKCSMKSIRKSKATDKDRIENCSEDSFNNVTKIKLTDKSETLMENVVAPAVNSIAISTDINESIDECSIDINESIDDECSIDINESIEDECSTAAMTTLEDSKLMEDKDTLVNIDAESKKQNIESCHKTDAANITDEENEMLKSIYLDSFPFKLISPIKEKYISKDGNEKSLKKEINVPIQDAPINPQILNLNKIETSIHSECTIESQAKELESSMFVKEVAATGEILTKNMKETEEFHLQSKPIDLDTEKINEISQEEENNIIINAEEQHNSAITTKEKSSELMKDTSINDPALKLLNPLKDNPISSDIYESSLKNKFDNPIQNVAIDSQRLIVRGLGALFDSKHTPGLKKASTKNIQKKSKLETKLNEKEEDLSTSGIYKNIKAHAKMSTDSINTTMPNDNLNIQSRNAIVHNVKVAFANTRVDTEHVNNDNKTSLVNPIVLLENYLNTTLPTGGLKKSKQERKKQESLIKKADKFVYKQLNRIVNNIDWTMPVHRDVVDKLSSTCSVRIIAKGVVDFMLIKRNNDFDKTYTPPAPIMTPAQQKIVALLVDLEVKVPTVMKWVQAGIEFKIFRLNYTPAFYQIENLIRLYIVLTRIQKDKEKLRMLCCDALYCLGFSAVPIIYTVLTCWPEVFPQLTENTDMLPKCIVHCIMSLQAKNLPQLVCLKNFLSMYFHYKKGSYLTKNLVEELLRSFETGSHSKEDTGSLRTAVILLAKKEGVSWTHNNIIRSILLPNIVCRKYTFMQDVFALLGNLMRTFPLEDKDGIVKRTIEQLVDLLNSGEGPHDQQEGVASALLSLSRHDLVKVMSTVMKWIPSEPLRTTTMNQYSAFFTQRTRAFWKKYLKSAKGKLTTVKSEDISCHNVYDKNK